MKTNNEGNGFVYCKAQLSGHMNKLKKVIFSNNKKKCTKLF